MYRGVGLAGARRTELDIKQSDICYIVSPRILKVAYHAQPYTLRAMCLI